MTNLEAKQEAIKKAYGEYWEKVKDYVDENGWIKDGQYHKGQPIDFEIMEVDWEYINNDFLSIIRPKSLQGIENNNGWIRIESEEDLPKEPNFFWSVIRDNKEVILSMFTRINKLKFFETYSHYQPIEKPKPPIY